MSKIFFCNECLYPSNHPLNLTFNKHGVCSGCIIHKEKYKIKWSLKINKLKKIINFYKGKNYNYDCIVPVSGARDSFFVLDFVKNTLKLNPLLVSYNKHYNTETGIRNLAYLKTIFDCDSVTLNVNPIKVKKITKKTFFKYGSIYWHILAGQTVFPIRKAVELNIPLIIWGAHQGVDQVGMFSHHDEVEMTRKYRKNHDLFGVEAEDLIDSQLNYSDLEEFFYPSDNKISNIGVKGIYLNNYMFWDSKRQHEQMIKKYNFFTKNQNRTIDIYNDVDCIHYSSLHDYIKNLKFGYSKIYDHLTRDIRLNKISRNNAIDLLKKYQNIKLHKNELKIFSNWLGIDIKKIENKLENLRNKKIWEYRKNNWYLKNPIIANSNEINIKHKYQFIKNNIKEPLFNDTKYILYHKGYKPLLDY